jgi:Helix-turn-helix domain
VGRPAREDVTLVGHAPGVERLVVPGDERARVAVVRDERPPPAGRVAIGIDLLTHTGLPVGDVASRSGFKSVYHFSRRVKEETGASPTAVRRAGWRPG